MQVSRRQPIRDDVKDQLNERFTKEFNDPTPTDDNPMPTPGTTIVVNDRQGVFYELPSSYRLPFIEQRLALDLRDDAAKPTKGAYFRVVAHEAIQFGKDTNIGEHSWNYIRLTPEARGYVPVGLGMVLAGRFALGWLGVLSAGKKLDAQAKALGPQSYRLRGGGAMSNRGFGPGELGDGRTGGTHRWEASLELRVPLSKNFYLVGFGDMGDVNAGFDIVRTFDPTRGAGDRGFQSQIVKRKDQNFRMGNLNTAVGGGLRYYTVIGPVRLDVGYRPKKLAWKSEDDYEMDLGFTKFRGAVHLTIGDAF